MLRSTRCCSTRRAKPLYEVADYCRLNAYAQLKLDGDAVALLNGLFTEQSVASLQAAWGQVRENLPEGMQSTVDAYEAAIVAALDNLELKTGGDLNFIDPSTLTATASDFQADGSDPQERSRRQHGHHVAQQVGHHDG